MGEYPSIIAVGTKALYLAPGERADVIVDFSKVPAGSKLILDNDAPAPAPNADSRVDYYTGDGDQTPIGGAPETVAGYGPNTRTIMQFQVDGPVAAPFDLERLRRALPAAYVAAQDPVLVPTEAYQDAYGDALGPAATLGDEPQDDTVPVVPQEESGTLTFTPLGRGVPADAPRPGQDGQRPLRSDVRPHDRHTRRRRAALGERRPDRGPRTRRSTRPPSTSDWSRRRRRRSLATPPRSGASPTTARHHTAWPSAGFDVQVLSRARRDGEARAPDPGELGLEGHAARRPARVRADRRPARAPRAPVQAAGQQPVAGHHAAAPRRGRVHAAGPPPRRPALPEVVNAPADLSFEACWSIHLMGGQESHTARPLVLQGTPQVPRAHGDRRRRPGPAASG